MSPTQMKLAPDQASRLARLLINFSVETAEMVLQRYDQTTRNQVRAAMHGLSARGQSSDDEMLSAFAEFLYFKPSDSMEGLPTRIRVPSLDRHPVSRPTETGLTINDIVAFDDSRLERLLKLAPPELTISLLTCSPESFVRRVLDCLSPGEANLVRQQISAKRTIDISEMKSIHQRYCEFVNRLVQQGRLQH